MKKPVLLYDGACNFCQYCVDYLTEIIGEVVDFKAYQKNTFGLKESECAARIQLITTSRTVFSGAAAGFKVLTFGGKNYGWWAYQKVPGFSTVTEKLYLWISQHRALCHKVAIIVLGNPWVVGRLKILSFITIFGLTLALTLALAAFTK